MIALKDINKIVLAGLFSTALLVSPIVAHADSWGHRENHHYPYGRSAVVLPHRSVTVVFGGVRFYYGDGHFFRRNVHDYVIVRPPVGAEVYSIPWECRRVIIAGTSYYTYEDVYYRRTANGYQVVQPSAYNTAKTVYASSVGAQDAITVNI